MAVLDITPAITETTTNVAVIVDLDGLTYRLDLKTNKRADAWTLDIYDGQGGPLVLGLHLAAGVDMLYPYRSLAVPPGKMYVSPRGETYGDPVIASFAAGTHALYYAEAE